jgi:hypothetical protein
VVSLTLRTAQATHVTTDRAGHSIGLLRWLAAALTGWLAIGWRPGRPSVGCGCPRTPIGGSEETPGVVDYLPHTAILGGSGRVPAGVVLLGHAHPWLCWWLWAVWAPIRGW